MKSRNICDNLPYIASLVKFLYTNWTSFGGAILEKLYFLLLAKPLKIYNLTTINAILMKLTTIMYLHQTFYWPKIGA